jgi:hypothetical protein
MYVPHASPGLIEALDEAIRLDLQNWRDSYFVWLIVSAAVVVIGVALEGPELVYEVKKIRRRCLGQKPLHAPDWVTLVALLGWGLVVLGVAGEGVAEGLVSRADATLQTFNDILLGEAQKEAAFAIERAANANKREAEIEQRLADRHITFEQRKKMLAILTPRRETRASVTYLTGSSSDAQEYAIEIGEVLHASGWTVIPVQQLISYETPVHGFLVEIRDKAPASKRKVLIGTTRKALAILDDRIAVTTAGNDPGLDVLILVGNK